jgi:hypothetical protein
VSGITTIRPSVALSLAGAAICIAVVAGCAGGEAPSGQPSFYQNLAQPDMTVDPAAAASMISGYRSNNGLGPVSVDPDLMRMANEQAIAMAQHDTMNHDIGKPFKERVSNSPCRGVFRLARLAAASRQFAQSRRVAARHRRRFFPELQIQGVLGAHSRGRCAAELVHDPEKWMPVFREDHAQAKCAGRSEWRNARGV